MIQEAGKGYEHHLEPVGRKHIINMDLVINADVKTDTIILRRGNCSVVTPMEEKKPKRKNQPRQQLRLSIIIPYYNAEPYTSQLLDVLAPQMRDDVEVIVVDDGSKEPFKTDHKFVKVIHKENGGCATARNVGIDKAEGEYISFIDADDLVARNFIEKVLEKTKDEPDVIDLSWKSLDGQGAQHDHKLLRDDDWLTNPSVCTRVFKRLFIGDIRFNEQKDSTEDEDFSRKVGFLDREGNFKHMVLSDYMYFYRTSVMSAVIWS
jgi:glycosyltransferase involved in cell wall biosynthesis